MRSPGLIWARSSHSTFASDLEAVASGVGGGEDHRLESDGIGVAEVIGRELFEVGQGLLDVGSVGFLAGGQEGQHDQGGGAGAGLLVDIGPGAVLILLTDEVAHAVADGVFHLGGGNFGFRGRGAENKKRGGDQKTAE